MSLWFTADQHFYHKKLLDPYRPFTTVEEMNQALIDRRYGRTLAGTEAMAIVFEDEGAALYARFDLNANQ